MRISEILSEQFQIMLTASLGHKQENRSGWFFSTLPVTKEAKIAYINIKDIILAIDAVNTNSAAGLVGFQVTHFK